jgi:toxin-antitoxin system PIN domain toxin
MSYSLDVNVLLYASDVSSQHHDAARSFLDRCANGRELLCLTWPTLLSYVRIATHPGIFTAPLSATEALANVEALLSLPQARVVTESEGFLDTYRHVTEGASVRGNLVPDAHLAALLFQHGVRTLYTNDRDFRRFETLDAKSPF